SERTGKLAFVFPGQGSQHLNMLGDLTLQFPEMLQVFEKANASLAAAFSKPLSHFIYPPPAFSEGEEAKQKEELTETQVAQPAIGAADVAVHGLLEKFDVRADMVAGHSYGEYVALYAAGCISLSDLWQISVQRGRLLGRATSGVKGGM